MINSTVHEKYMRRCIELASLGLGNTAPNPMVGSVIVCDNKIIGEGYHKKVGGAHAEVNAINSVKDKSLLKKSTIYVNLEPCSHFGKTPPCANLIAELGIPNVIIGTSDTAAHVSGKGIKILRDAGCNVTIGVLENEARELNKRFFTFHEKKRPYIILKWAETKDGFIDKKRENDSQKPEWISNELSKKLVHKWRSEEQAILVGTNTIIADDSELTARNWNGKSPLRIVFDRSLKLSNNYKVFNDKAETLIIADTYNKDQENRDLMSNIGIEFVDYSKDFYAQLLKAIHKRNIQSVIVEGGEKVLNSFFKSNNWDEARIFYGNINFNEGVKAPKLNAKELKTELLGEVKLSFVQNSDSFNQ